MSLVCLGLVLARLQQDVRYQQLATHDQTRQGLPLSLCVIEVVWHLGGS